MEPTVNKVSPSSLTHFVGNVAVVTTIFQFLSGVLVCRQYVRNKTTAEASALPFLFGVLSASLWLLYGTLKQDEKVIFVNTVGAVLMVAYVVVFYKYSSKKKYLVRQIIGCVVFGLIMWGYISTENDIERQTSVIGFIACDLTLLTVAAPLVKLYHVIKVKSTECLPFQMIVMSFFVSVVWLLYGFLNQDFFIMAPNIIGILLALVQLGLFVKYPRTRTPKSSGSAKAMLA